MGFQAMDVSIFLLECRDNLRYVFVVVLGGVIPVFGS